jgi:hypothetical protein
MPVGYQETKNDDDRLAPIRAELRAMLVEQRSRRQAGCHSYALGLTPAQDVPSV